MLQSDYTPEQQKLAANEREISGDVQRLISELPCPTDWTVDG